MRHINTSDLSGEERYEAESAFGEDADLIELEPDDLEPVETPEYPIRHVLEEGDWLTVQHNSGCVTTGPVYDVDRLWVKIDPRNRTTTDSVMYGDLRRYKDGERGVVNELIDINGRPADRVLSERMEEAGL